MYDFGGNGGDGIELCCADIMAGVYWEVVGDSLQIPVLEMGCPSGRSSGQDAVKVFWKHLN